MHYSQPLPAIINIPAGGKASLRLVNLSVAEYFTLQSQGVPMHVVGFNAKLLRDQDGNSTEFYTNSITLGGGESLDVILDASDDGCSAYLGTGCAKKLFPAGSTFYVYSSNLEMLSNDAENFGGMMTEVHICNSVTGSTHRRCGYVWQHVHQLRRAAMRLMNMKNATFKTQLFLALAVAVSSVACAGRFRCGSRNHRHGVRPGRSI